MKSCLIKLIFALIILSGVTFAEGTYSYDLKLLKGWNLFSSPVYDFNLITPFKKFQNDCQYISSLWEYNQEQKKYFTATYLSNIKTSYWIKVGNDCTVRISGDEQNSNLLFNNIQLTKGWNFIGGFSENTNFENIKGSCNSVNGLYYYDTIDKKWKTTNTLESGKGYIINVNNDCQLKFEEILPPTPNPPIFSIYNLTSGQCTAILKSGDMDKKINIYFYTDSNNSHSEDYFQYPIKVTSTIFGGSFKNIDYPGIEPFKTLKNEFNVYLYKDEFTCGASPFYCHPDIIRQKLKESCEGFIESKNYTDGNYNIIVIPFDTGEWGSSSGGVPIQRNSTHVRLGSIDTIFHNIDFPLPSLVHEFGHVIGFFGEGYNYYQPYLGAQTEKPNIDSFSCSKWCQGVDTKSSCYINYTKWIDCFKSKFIINNVDIQKIITSNNLNFASNDYSWWGNCFNSKNINICGGKIEYIIDSRIRPNVYGINKEPDNQWISDWEYCKNQNPNIAGTSACNLGLNCNGGCFAGAAFSRFLSHSEDSTLMGSDYSLTSQFSINDEDMLRYNILHRLRYIDVENMQYQP